MSRRDDRLMSSQTVLVAGLAGLALLIRLLPVLRGAGFTPVNNYDESVYYAAADSLTFGRLPYRNFVLLHPPGQMLILVPFTLLGRLSSDPIGMEAARLFFVGVGVLNTVLVFFIVRRWSRGGAWIGGLLYACWAPSALTEQGPLLEPLGTTALLVALLLLLKRSRAATVWTQILAGSVLGVCLTLKIWGVVPVAVITIWQFGSRGRTAGLRLMAGEALSAAPILLPFFLLAPRQMLRMVVRDQFVRPKEGTPRAARIPRLSGVSDLIRGHSGAEAVVTAAVVLAITYAAVVCLRDPSARVLTAILIGDAAVLLSAPTFFSHYEELTAAPAALVIGVTAGKLMRAESILSLGRAVVAVLTVAVAISGLHLVTQKEVGSFPAARFAAAAPPGCLASDDPAVLIALNRLSTDLRQDCQVPVDVSGITYDSLRRTKPDGAIVGRHENKAWQRYLYDYLTSAGSFVVARAAGDGLPSGGSAALKRHPVLARSGRFVLRRGRPG